MLCDFIATNNGYMCKSCGMFIKTSDGLPPIFPCKKNTIREENENTVSFVQKVKNFAGAVASHTANGMKLASDETILIRYNICEKCEFFDNGSCSKCGCPLYKHKKFVSKLSWAEQSCPVDKWGPETT